MYLQLTTQIARPLHRQLLLPEPSQYCTLVNPNFRFGRRYMYSVDNGLVLLCAASRDAMITFGVELNAGDAASVP